MWGGAGILETVELFFKKCIYASQPHEVYKRCYKIACMKSKLGKPHYFVDAMKNGYTVT